MWKHDTLLGAPRIVPKLDAGFRPAVVFNRRFAKLVEATGNPETVELALEQADGSVFRFTTRILPANHPDAEANVFYIERYVKFLLWSRGGFRIHFAGPADLAKKLAEHYTRDAAGRFDAHMMGDRIYERPFEVRHCRREDLPPAKSVTQPLGRHLNGCRIGFDLGGSDRKVAAVIDGKAVFTDETPWDPVPQADPQYHFDGIMDSLRKAARYLPKVDAIGGSAAGVY
ncbi:MAG: ROK family protein, partial [Verrucomicrobiae bacterium]|nr:ROK family protein [Verrucomicrobiae bacterium]